MLRTPLFGAHEHLKARLTEFAGWEMPLSYSGVAAEHRAVRESSGVFDLCHMGRLVLEGTGVAPVLERLAPSRIATLRPGRARYTVILNGDGGIVDDVIVTRESDTRYHLCVNAVNRERVVDLLRKTADGGDTRVADLTLETAQIAVQGPDSAELVRPLLAGADFPAYMHTVRGEWEGQEIVVSRTGYTGELGVELFLPAAAAPSLWQRLVEEAVPCGLGARDTLRLEAGYPLYGHELTESVTPVAAGIGWVVDWSRSDLPARARLERDRKAPEQLLCGFSLSAPGVPRDGFPVFLDGRSVGVVTSGNMGISVGHGIGMTWLPAAHTDPGNAIEIEIRGRRIPAVVEQPPFYTRGTVRQSVD
ncbi:MAG: glycine cleavage system aminomethyltransferase GcvT [Nitrospirota bacterium]|nr:glycine cleavage system aminomethyltransferase GcvT [Nitrospirota bacterium]